MAWRAQSTTPVMKGDADMRLYVHVIYYDDADAANTPTPTNLLHQADFAFDSNTSLNELRAMIQNQGALARTSQTRATALNSSFPVGTTIAVP